MNYSNARVVQENGKYAVEVENCKVVLSDKKQKNLTFSGNVCHIFDKDGMNLEF